MQPPCAIPRHRACAAEKLSPGPRACVGSAPSRRAPKRSRAPGCRAGGRERAEGAGGCGGAGGAPCTPSPRGPASWWRIAAPVRRSSRWTADSGSSSAGSPRRPPRRPRGRRRAPGPCPAPLSAEEGGAARGRLSPGKPAGRRDRGCLAELPRILGSLLLSGPRLVFNRVNGRRPPATSPSLEGPQEPYTLAHEENVRFVSEAWQQVEEQLDAGSTGESGLRPVQYVERTPNPRLQGFVPIDLDEWWAQQFLARVTNCS